MNIYKIIMSGVIPCKGVGLVVDFKTTFNLSTYLVY